MRCNPDGQMELGSFTDIYAGTWVRRSVESGMKRLTCTRDAESYCMFIAMDFCIDRGSTDDVKYPSPRCEKKRRELEAAEEREKGRR